MSQPSETSWSVTRLEVTAHKLVNHVSEIDLPEVPVPHPEQLGQLDLAALAVVADIAAHVGLLGGRIDH